MGRFSSPKQLAVICPALEVGVFRWPTWLHNDADSRREPYAYHFDYDGYQTTIGSLSGRGLV